MRDKIFDIIASIIRGASYVFIGCAMTFPLMVALYSTYKVGATEPNTFILGIYGVIIVLILAVWAFSRKD